MYSVTNVYLQTFLKNKFTNGIAYTKSFAVLQNILFNILNEKT